MEAAVRNDRRDSRDCSPLLPRVALALEPGVDGCNAFVADRGDRSPTGRAPRQAGTIEGVHLQACGRHALSSETLKKTTISL
jgi:hypothetical protein